MINGLYRVEAPGRGDHSRRSSSLCALHIDWFNNRRLLDPIGNVPPAEAEERYYAMLEQPAMAA